MTTVDETEGVADPSLQEDAPALRRRAWTDRANVVPAVLLAVMVALLGTSAYLWQERRTNLDQSAVEVARQQAEGFFSLDHRDPDKGIDEMLALTTTEFRESYEARRDQVVANLTKKKIVVTASVPEDGAAVEYLHGDRAEVLVAVDVTTGARSQGTESQRYRTRVELSRVDGEWLVSAINQVG
jgi:hypothetical protein